MFQEFPEGDLLDHVKAHQPLYLGAIFAVIKEWYRAGKPTTKESRHDFRRWVRVLDWIVQNLLLGAPIMEGHRQTQQRMTKLVPFCLHQNGYGLHQLARKTTNRPRKTLTRPSP